MNIINVISDKNVPKWGNGKKFIAIHYLGVVGQNNKVEAGGYGAHYYIYWDGTIYQAAKHDAILWQVGTGGYYTQKHPEARNSNTIGIELCVKCDGNASNPSDPYWYFTEETQEACVQLVKKLMQDLSIPASHVLRHYDIVNKHCPAPYVNNNKYKTSWTWEEFKARISGGSSGSGDSSAGGTDKPVISGATYIVQAGDTLTKIAAAWGISVDDLAAYNRIKNPNVINVGQVIKKPGSASSDTYTVKKGDTLSEIAAMWGVKTADLAAYNGIKDPDVINVGQVIKKPTGVSTGGWKAIGTATCTGQGVNVRSGPGTSYDSLGKLGKGNRFEVDGQEKNGFMHIKVHLNGKDRIAWISSQYVKRD